MVVDSVPYPQRRCQRLARLNDFLILIACNWTLGNFYTELLKYQISGLRLSEQKNAIIEFLSAQIIAKPPDTTSINYSDNYRQHTNGINKSNHDDVSQENDGAKKKEVIIVVINVTEH